jgi:hypothetical protein
VAEIKETRSFENCMITSPENVLQEYTYRYMRICLEENIVILAIDTRQM